MGAEDPSVVVTLVDHDVAKRAEEPRPARMTRQQGVMEHVGVGEDVLRVVAGPQAQLGRGVTVVGGAAQAGKVEAQQRGELVLRQRLGGRQVEHARTPLPLRAACGLDGLQPGQQVAERLPGRGAGGDDRVLTAVGEVGGHPLVRPRIGYADALERLAHRVTQPVRPGRVLGGPRRRHLEVQQAVGAPGCATQPPHQRFEIHHLHPVSLPVGSDALPTAEPRSWFNTVR